MIVKKHKWKLFCKFKAQIIECLFIDTVVGKEVFEWRCPCGRRYMGFYSRLSYWVEKGSSCLP